jgi:hypothetical protein
MQTISIAIAMSAQYSMKVFPLLPVVTAEPRIPLSKLKTVTESSIGEWLICEVVVFSGFDRLKHISRNHKQDDILTES